MAWLAVHPRSTKKYQLPDGEADAPVFEFGFWPPHIDVQLGPKTRTATIAKPKDFKLDPVKDMDAFIKQTGLDLEIYREAARWSVRGWTGGGIEAKTETVVADGNRYVKLSEESLEVLYHNGLLFTVGARAVLFNVLTEDQKKSFESRSGSPSSSSPTDAIGATADGSQSTTAASSSESDAS